MKKKKLKEVTFTNMARRGAWVTLHADSNKNYFAWRDDLLKQIFNAGLAGWEFLGEIQDEIDIDRNMKLQLAGRGKDFDTGQVDYDDQDTRKWLSTKDLMKVNRGELLKEIKIAPLLVEVSARAYTSLAKKFPAKLNDEELNALRSWTVNIKTKYKNYMTQPAAKRYIASSPNIQTQSQKFIKSIFGDKPFNVYRSFYEGSRESGLKSYSVSATQAKKFNRFGEQEKRTITYKDVVAVPALGWKGWDSGGYENEAEIILKK